MDFSRREFLTASLIAPFVATLPSGLRLEPNIYPITLDMEARTIVVRQPMRMRTLCTSIKECIPWDKTPFPMAAITEHLFQLVSGWRFMGDRSRSMMRESAWTEEGETYCSYVAIGQMRPSSKLHVRTEYQERLIEPGEPMRFDGSDAEVTTTGYEALGGHQHPYRLSSELTQTAHLCFIPVAENMDINGPPNQERPEDCNERYKRYVEHPSAWTVRQLEYMHGNT